MQFEIEVKSMESDALTLEYFLVPWDSELLARPVAQLHRIVVRDYNAAKIEFARFVEWQESNAIAFSAAKVSHRSSNESRLIQAFDYRFIELNYRPEAWLEHCQISTDAEFEFQESGAADKEELCNIASKAFHNTRFHLDPLLGQEIGDLRYKTWMENAFDLPHQHILKCMHGDTLLAFFVQEFPAPNNVFWSLVGLVPGLQGKGLGKRIWPAAMHRLREQGISKVSTSISSLNTPVLNLYARLGFRFPEPEMTFHWHRPVVKA